MAGCKAAEHNQRDAVGDGHETVGDVGDGPDSADGHVGTDGYGHDVQQPEDSHCLHFSTGKVFQAALAVVVPAQDGGKGKEHQAEHQQELDAHPITSQHLGKGGRGEGNTLQFRIAPNIFSGYDDGESSHGTDNQCIDDSSSHAHQALFNRILHLGGAGGYGGGAKSGLVGEDSPGNTLLHGISHLLKDKSHRTTGKGLQTKGTLEDGGKGGRNLCGIHYHYTQSQEYVDNGHKGNNNFRNLGNPL